jgi:Fe-Mn family superoxide dismutase
MRARPRPPARPPARQPYAYNALEPHIDEATMKVHHTGHHQAYTDNLNKGLDALKASGAEGAALAALPLDALLQRLAEVPEAVRPAIRNHGGGYMNHRLFFCNWMAPPTGAAPPAELAAAIDAAFGSLDKFKEDFSAAAAKVFGSGWAWLVVDRTGGAPVLKVVATSNQDSPAFTPGVTPILGLDVWEHAYYLKYMNKRAAYISAWWNVVNWPEVARMYSAARA